MTLVILLLALLALVVGSGSEPPAPRTSLVSGETAGPQAPPRPGERHDTDDGLAPQPLLRRPGVMPGKARPQMTSRAQLIRSPWQGAPAAPNLFNLKGLLAIGARIPSGAYFARAPTRAS